MSVLVVLRSLAVRQFPPLNFGIITLTEQRDTRTFAPTGRREAGSSRLPLELGLEISKRVSNLRLDFIKRVGDQRPIFERYLAKDVNLHIHVHASERMWCLTFEALDPVQIIPLKAGVDGNAASAFDQDEMPVFVRVGAVSEPPRPVASIVRLKPLDACDMFGVDAFEQDCRAVSGKVLCRIHNRKLGLLLRTAGIESGEFVDEIVEGAPKVVANLADQSSDAHTVESLCGKEDIFRAVRRVWIDFERDGVSLFLRDDGYFPLQLSKVFVCPAYSLEAGIKNVLAVIDRG